MDSAFKALNHKSQANLTEKCEGQKAAARVELEKRKTKSGPKHAREPKGHNHSTNRRVVGREQQPLHQKGYERRG